MAEGSIWEALDKASYYKLANLIAIIDINRLGQRGPTELSWDLDTYAARAAAFGARVFVIDGREAAAATSREGSGRRSPAGVVRVKDCLYASGGRRPGRRGLGRGAGAGHVR